MFNLILIWNTHPGVEVYLTVLSTEVEDTPF